MKDSEPPLLWPPGMDTFQNIAATRPDPPLPRCRLQETDTMRIMQGNRDMVRTWQESDCLQLPFLGGQGCTLLHRPCLRRGRNR